MRILFATVAKKYGAGMESILNGAGSRIATGLYSFLDFILF